MPTTLERMEEQVLSAAPANTVEPALTPAPERVLIVRLGSMGDMVHTLPAVATLRRAWPGAMFGWLVEERWAELLCSRVEFRDGSRTPEKPLIDVVHVVRTREWRDHPFARKTLRDLQAALRELRSSRYELALDFQSALRSAAFSQLSRAPQRLGFSRTIECPASLFYTRRVEAIGEHVVEQNLSLALAAARRATPYFGFELPRDSAADAVAARQLSQRGFVRFCLMNAAAGWGAKCWPAERFGEVALALGQLGMRSLVNYGPGEEPIAHAVVERAGGAAEAITCSMSELIAITRRARLCIGGDTGPTHLAAALGIPVVAIYGPTDPARNGPFGSPSIVLRSSASATDHARRHDPERGLLNITSREVIAAAERLLSKTEHRVSSN
jgi:heptosyltransferase-1